MHGAPAVAEYVQAADGTRVLALDSPCPARRGARCRTAAIPIYTGWCRDTARVQVTFIPNSNDDTIDAYVDNITHSVLPFYT